MLVYHGTTLEIKEPKIMTTEIGRDFGFAFYTTDIMGDWLYLKLMLCNIGTFIKAALGDRSGLDKMLDRLFYDYNG